MRVPTKPFCFVVVLVVVLFCFRVCFRDFSGVGGGFSALFSSPSLVVRDLFVVVFFGGTMSESVEIKSFLLLLLLLLVSLERERERERASKPFALPPSLIGFRRRRQKKLGGASFLIRLNTKRNWTRWIYFTTVVFCCVFFRRERERERACPK